MARFSYDRKDTWAVSMLTNAMAQILSQRIA
jgi:hypothetical protein